MFSPACSTGKSGSLGKPMQPENASQQDQEDANIISFDLYSRLDHSLRAEEVLRN